MDVLKDNPPPETHRIAAMAAGANQVAWKTGTSHGFRDAWAVGICDGLVVAVWVGNFDGQGDRVFVGRSAAGPLLFEVLAALVPDRGWTVEEEANVSRLNLRQVDVCALTGELPGKYCRHTKKSGFIPGVSPIRVCGVHRAIPVDAAASRRACRHVPGKTEMRVFEFWPSDLLSIFRAAGIALKNPPPFDEDCHLGQQATSGRPPAITSPQPGLVAAMNSESSNARQVPFLAVADGDVRRL